jgi:predicted nucleic acid-binding protein
VGDTGFWIAAFDKRDNDHFRAAGLLEDLRHSIILMPWPIMYEVLRTRTVKRPEMVSAFGRVLTWPKVRKIDDHGYRIRCLENTLAEAASGRPISLVDMVVREVLCDDQFRVSRLLTFNPRDFHDVCRDRRITLWPGHSS